MGSPRRETEDRVLHDNKLCKLRLKSTLGLWGDLSSLLRVQGSLSFWLRGATGKTVLCLNRIHQCRVPRRVLTSRCRLVCFCRPSSPSVMELGLPGWNWQQLLLGCDAGGDVCPGWQGQRVPGWVTGRRWLSAQVGLVSRDAAWLGKWGLCSQRCRPVCLKWRWVCSCSVWRWFRQVGWEGDC